MNFNLPLGKWFGIPVILHWSWLLLFGLVLFTNPSLAITYAGLFFLVLLHEFGHAMAGRHLHYDVHSITLYPFGGMARMEIPVEPKQELFVALAGPAVNAALLPVFWVASQYNVLIMLGYCNIMLLVFNLMPALPMDGGRAFRSILAMFLNDHYRATVIAARVSQVVCVGFAALGIMIGAFMLVVIAFFIFFAASGEIEASKNRILHRRLASIEGSSDVMKSAELLKTIQKRVAHLDK